MNPTCTCSRLMTTIPAIAVLLIFFETTPVNQSASSTIHAISDDSPTEPSISDPHLKVEVIFRGMEFPTNMVFLGRDDILVLEKNEGTINRIVNGQALDEPLMSIDVSENGERGMLGIEYEHGQNMDKLTTDGTLYIFMTEENDGEIFNHLYRYDLSKGLIKNPEILLEVPGTPGPKHNGGEVIIGPDGYIYTIIGDVSANLNKASNKGNDEPDGRAGILRLTRDGESVESVIGEGEPANKYYAYGIRNGFGMDFDPVTKDLWDTENGENFDDEINHVKRGFNSGWNQIQGLSEFKDNFKETNLVDFDGKGEYSDPEFVWSETVGVTAIRFLDSDRYGQEYENDMFIGDFNNGNLYHFELNEERTGLELEGELEDKIANNQDELEPVIFGTGFGGITDIQVGPDGYLYVLANGSIFRIIPTVKSLENI
jgi:glucose/arabinose dehydrogenase